MNEVRELTNEEARERVGETVTIWPRVNRDLGESRDTEAGLQPWNAMLIGVTLDGEPIVQQVGGEARTLRVGRVAEAPTGQLRIGRP